jgi:hypothetical protein
MSQNTDVHEDCLNCPSVPMKHFTLAGVWTSTTANCEMTDVNSECQSECLVCHCTQQTHHQMLPLYARIVRGPQNWGSPWVIFRQHEAPPHWSSVVQKFGHNLLCKTDRKKRVHSIVSHEAPPNWSSIVQNFLDTTSSGRQTGRGGSIVWSPMEHRHTGVQSSTNFLIQPPLEDRPEEAGPLHGLPRSSATLSSTVQKFLDTTFSGRQTGRGGSTAWSPRSPDLTPTDFFLRRYGQHRCTPHRPGTHSLCCGRCVTAWWALSCRSNSVRQQSGSRRKYTDNERNRSSQSFSFGETRTHSWSLYGVSRHFLNAVIIFRTPYAWGLNLGISHLLLAVSSISVPSSLHVYTPWW